MAKLRTGAISDLEHSVSGEKLSLLAVFAYSEDEAFGPSGTLAKYAGEGVRVSLVTAVRDSARAGSPVRDSTLVFANANANAPARDKTCSCRAAGIHRVCLDEAPRGYSHLSAGLIEERLVRLIRQLQPQVIVTYAPEGLSGESDQMLVSRLAYRAFDRAGDLKWYPSHLDEGLQPFQPQKLYYSVLPFSVINQWGLTGLNGVPDNRVTTVLDVSPYSEIKLKALYCQRHHVLDFNRWLDPARGLQWKEEHFVLAASRVNRRPRRERDLFAGLR